MFGTDTYQGTTTIDWALHEVERALALDHTLDDEPVYDAVRLIVAWAKDRLEADSDVYDDPATAPNPFEGDPDYYYQES